MNLNLNRMEPHDVSSWLQGDQFDAVMNHRFQKALVGYFAEEQMDTHAFDRTLRHLLKDYPEPGTAVMLNLLGNHDTARPMTVVHRRDGGSHALESLKLMAATQFACPGAPCIYYCDEIGMEGDKDPDCRRCYPWDWEQRAEESGQRSELLAYYKRNCRRRRPAGRPTPASCSIACRCRSARPRAGSGRRAGRR
ncbi:MAG: alpha-amylase family glycosyl hydrolase [Candidatus Competibacter sp.]|nr:alpha-amylase family glycosyl hydrolase [Candidatus Competibacter sp.]